MSSAPIAPAPKLTAIQLIEQELSGFIQQREQAIANVHAVDGAIQGAQRLLAKLKQAAAEAEAETKKAAASIDAAFARSGPGEAGVEPPVAGAEAKSNVVEFPKTEL
jgi:hypothetical protein